MGNKGDVVFDAFKNVDNDIDKMAKKINILIILFYIGGILGSFLSLTNLFYIYNRGGNIIGVLGLSLIGMTLSSYLMASNCIERLNEPIKMTLNETGRMKANWKQLSFVFFRLGVIYLIVYVNIDLLYYHIMGIPY